MQQFVYNETLLKCLALLQLFILALNRVSCAYYLPVPVLHINKV